MEPDQSDNRDRNASNFILFAMLLAVLLVRVGALKIGARSSETSTWRLSTSAFRPSYIGPERARVGKVGMGVCSS